MVKLLAFGQSPPCLCLSFPRREIVFELLHLSTVVEGIKRVSEVTILPVREIIDVIDGFN